MQRIGKVLFRWRSYTPLPFLFLMTIVGTPTVSSLLVGIFVMCTGEALRMWGVAHAGELTRVVRGGVGAPELVTSGPFSYVRNPLYVGNILIYTGVGIASGVWWMALAGFVWFSFQYAAIVSEEESFLAQEFGGIFIEFTKNVPRFLPRFTPYRSNGKESHEGSFSRALGSERRTLQAFAIVTIILILLYVLRHHE